MNSYSPFSTSPMSRRTALLGIAAGTVGLSLAGCGAARNVAESEQKTYPDSELLLVSTIHTATNDYMQNWLTGSRAFAKYAGLPLRIVNSNLDSQQQYSQIQSAMATGKRVVVNLEPLASADVPGIARSVARNGGYVVSSWDKPDGIKPEDIGPSWVSHMGFDGVAAGEYTATQLFEAMGGEGGIIALKGVLDSNASKQRYAGLEKALAAYPGISLLGSDSANWDRQTAYTKTQTLLSRFAGKVNGIWAGSDSMTLGAVAAAESAGVQVKAVGIDGIQEALKSVKTGGPIVATWYSDGFYSGMIGLAIGHAAATGKLDVSTLQPAQRDGTYSQFGVSRDSVDKYLKEPDYTSLMAELDKGLFNRLVGGPLPSVNS